MNQISIPSPEGYAIPCLYQITGGEQRVCLVSHGFGSSKRSPTALRLFEALPSAGFGVLAFDFAAHGDSPADGQSLSVTGCLHDLAAAEAFARSRAPGAEIVYFSSSFGAYINLLYLARKTDRRCKAFLRAAAIEMPHLFDHRSPAAEQSLRRCGWFVPDYPYARPMRLTQRFLDEMAENDVFDRYTGRHHIAMAHGGADETACCAAAQRFAEVFGAELTVFPDEGHRLDGAGVPDRVVQLATDFYLQPR
ncbi:MAG: alpha/beta hydrolase [Agathobaculum sp.]|jgi:pimeloyl-ACP methyl ester carboxylesterase|uniref:alpha/beta hydrolase n=1 Tax=Agathobaculum sp. TaxID=2048138 RepID=UPI003D8DD215